MNAGLDFHSFKEPIYVMYINNFSEDLISWYSDEFNASKFHWWCLLCVSQYWFQCYLWLGNVMNGPIGKQMVDTLVESQANVEVKKKPET